MPVKHAPYDIGDDLHLGALVTDVLDAATDPDTITLEILCPDGTTITLHKADLTNPGIGAYETIYTVANGWGVYKVTWTGKNAFAIVEQDSFRVRKPAG